MKSKKTKKIKTISKIFDFRMIFYDFVKITGAIPTIIFMRMKFKWLKKSKPSTKPYLIVSNHVSYLDPVIISNAFWYRRVRFITTDYFFQKKASTLFFRSLGCIPVSKENVAVATFKEAKKTIDRGHCLCLFPEGGVERHEQIDNFKSGAIMMALICDTPIVMVYIEKRLHWYQRQKVIIGEKINVKDYFTSPYPNMEEIQNVAGILREKELELADKLHNSYQKKGK